MMSSLDQHERVKLLSDSDLRQELMQAGEAVGPITSSTRPIFERKLLRCLLGDQAHTTEPQLSTVCSLSQNGKTDADRSLNSSLSSEGDRIVYYGVAVPSNCTETAVLGTVCRTICDVSGRITVRQPNISTKWYNLFIQLNSVNIEIKK